MVLENDAAGQAAQPSMTASTPAEPVGEKVGEKIVGKHRIKVLLVDDQLMIGEMVRRMLADAPEVEYHYCGNPADAIPLAQEVAPTVILQDLVMPDVDGLLLLRFYRANEKTKDIPIIVLSAKEEPITKAEAFALGANDYLVKLPDKIELLARIRYHSTGYIHLLERNEAFAALNDSLAKLKIEQDKSERLLLNILPKPIADRLKAGEKTIAESFPDVTVLFGDICGFTELSARISPTRLVEMLNELFSAFDHRVDEIGLEKIKTIGDAYMVVAGLPMPRSDHAEAMAEMAIKMQEEVGNFNQRFESTLQIRIGVHSGPVVAGVIGKKKFIYDLWGDTVNTASRMESHGVPGRVQVSESTYDILRDKYEFEDRGVIKIKGKGDMSCYLIGARKSAAAS